MEVVSKQIAIISNMQTLTGTFEQQQQPVSLQLRPAEVDHQEGVIARTIVPSITTEDESASDDIRPITPEVTYPYPLYKTVKYYKRRLPMKPNQVSKSTCFVLSKRVHIYI